MFVCNMQTCVCLLSLYVLSMAVLLYLLVLFYYEYINNVGGFYIQPITLFACISSKAQYEKPLVLSPYNQSNTHIHSFL
jgi:hypothetical protein